MSTRKAKSYIYSNFSPLYAQMFLVVLRAHHNFFLKPKSKTRRVFKDEKKNKICPTPAQKLGIAVKACSWDDILYG